MDKEVRLSVIIPTRNRAGTLKTCLSSLQRQTLPSGEFEVIVVDNGSTDETKEVANTFAESSNLVYCYTQEPGLHIGRHEGLRLARTSILVFGDDDIEAESTWLEAIVELFNDPAVGLAGGNNYPAFEACPPAWLSRLWNRSVYKGRALGTLSVLDFGHGIFELDARYIWGCNFAIRRDVLERSGGFHPDGVPNERLRYRGDGETHVTEFVRASGMKAMFDSRASIYHLVSKERMTRDYFRRRYYAQGVSDSYKDIRKANGIPDSRLSLLNFTRRARRRLIDKVKQLGHSNDRVEAELAAVLRSSQQAYWDGYRFHMKEVAKDPALLAWVLRPSYL